MSLMRSILLYVEERPAGEVLTQVSVPAGHAAADVAEHIELLIQEGLLDGTVYHVSDPRFTIQKLTWQGHDFLSATRDETVWRKVLSKASELGGAMTIHLAVDLAKQYIREKAGLPT